jgi:hypothetical protein
MADRLRKKGDRLRGPGLIVEAQKRGQTALSTDERLTMASECVDWGQSGQSLFFCVAS